AGLLGVLEVRHVPEVSDGAAVGSETGTVDFVELVVENDEALVFLVEEPALVGVRCALVGSARDDGGVAAVGHVVDGEGLLVVTVANVTAEVLLVGSLVRQALSIVHVAVLGSAAGGSGVGGVLQVDKDET